MKIEEVLEVSSRIEKKLKETKRIEKVKDAITTPTVDINITIPPKSVETFTVDSAELKKVLDKLIASLDTSADQVELKNKAK